MTKVMAQALSTALALWRAGLLSEDELIQWVDRQILALPDPDEALLELSLKGPRRYMDLPSQDFPQARMLSFIEERALRIAGLDLNDDAALQRFAPWLAKVAMGEDLDDPIVKIGYLVDHLLYDCGDMAAVLKHLRSELPPVVPACRERSEAIWASII